MARRKSKPAVSENRLFVLALGLLVGFVAAFVLLLSRMPVDGIISQYKDDASRESEMTNMSFDYYSVLPEQKAPRKPPPRVIAVEPPVVFMEPPTRLEPQNRALAAPQIVQRPQVQPRVEPPAIRPQPQVRPTAAPVREILASESGQDSYYVEAGNYRENVDALQVQSSLRSLGLEAFIVVRQDNGGSFGHRVRIGPFFEQSRLNATRERLRASGITPRLIRVKG